MQSDILQKFLDQGLIDLGEGTDKFSYLSAAAEDVAKQLKEDRRKLIRASSLLVGGELGESDSILVLCREAIKLQWPTYRSRFPSDTKELFRAILLQAIAHIVEGDSDCSYAAIVLYTARGPLQYVGREREGPIFREFLSTLDEKVAREATRIWASPRIVALPSVKYGDVAAQTVGIDTKALKEGLKNSAGPSGVTGANPEWPSSNTAEWLEHFGQGAANSIATAVSAVLKKIIAQGRSDNEAALVAIKDMVNGVNSGNIRAEILYWKEALYSSARKRSYRRIAVDSAAYWAASDLHDRVPNFHPERVEFFLRETVRASFGDAEAEKALTIEQFCNGIAQETESITCTDDPSTNQRLTLLQAAQGAGTKRLNARTASVQTGIPAKTAIPREELAVWLFRDFQASRLAGDK
jgi:GTPase-associated system helical domain